MRPPGARGETVPFLLGMLRSPRERGVCGAAAVRRVSAPSVLASPGPGISGGVALPARAGERGPLGEGVPASSEVWEARRVRGKGGLPSGGAFVGQGVRGTGARAIRHDRRLALEARGAARARGWIWRVVSGARGRPHNPRCTRRGFQPRVASRFDWASRFG